MRFAGSSAVPGQLGSDGAEKLPDHLPELRGAFVADDRVEEGVERGDEDGQLEQVLDLDVVRVPVDRLAQDYFCWTKKHFRLGTLTLILYQYG